MANRLIQTVFQMQEESIPKRFIVQFIDEEGNHLQTINNYDDLTNSEREIFDNFQELSESKMINND